MDNGREERLSLWPTLTFEYGGIKVKVERQTVRHSIALARILSALPDIDDPAERFYQILFARIVTQTLSVEGMTWPFPELGAPNEEWARAYEHFLCMDGRLIDRWFEALSEVDRPPSEREHWPPSKLTEEERKNLASAG